MPFSTIFLLNHEPCLAGSVVGVWDSTWWFRVRSPVEANCLSSVFSPPISAEACEYLKLVLMALERRVVLVLV